MTKITTTHQLSPTQQLVDLNGDMTTFELEFNAICTSNNGSRAPFHGAVVTQATINSGEPFNYKHCPDGAFGAKIVADQGIYQNYFLALKADQPGTCVVNVNRTAIPARLMPQQPPPVSSSHKKNQSLIDWKLIVICAIIIGCGLIGYYHLKKKNTTTATFTTSTGIEPLPSNTLFSQGGPCNSSTNVRSTTMSPPQPPSAPIANLRGSSLLERLNNLPIS
jgi:hypothetical protein